MHAYKQMCSSWKYVGIHISIDSRPVYSLCGSIEFFTPYHFVCTNMSLMTLSEYVFTDESADGQMKTITWLQVHQLLVTTV